MYASESSKVTLACIPGRQGIPGDDEADRLAKETTTGVPVGQTAIIPFIVGKKFIKRYLEMQRKARYDACSGCRQSSTLMRYLLPSRADEPLAVSILRLRVAVGLLKGDKPVRNHIH
jgi:hypothetical protein